MATYDGIPRSGGGCRRCSTSGPCCWCSCSGGSSTARGVGLVAAALSAATVIHIQLSHFFAVDTFLAFATTLALYAAYRAWLRWGYLSFLLLGFAAGWRWRPS